MEHLLELASKTWAWISGLSDFWESFIATVAGVLAAFELERRRDNRDNSQRELGQCHILVFHLYQILNGLQDFNEQLFEAPSKRHGRPVRWDEIGGLEGAPEHGPTFTIGDYTFLVDGSDQNSEAPLVLSKIQRVTQNFEAILARINRRTQLWHDYLPHRATPLGRGESALPSTAERIVLSGQIEELTQWLRDDIPEEIGNIKLLLPQLYKVMSLRFKRNKFLVPRPADRPQSTP